MAATNLFIKGNARIKTWDDLKPLIREKMPTPVQNTKSPLKRGRAIEAEAVPSPFNDEKSEYIPRPEIIPGLPFIMGREL